MNNLANNLLYVILLVPGVVFVFAAIARLALLVVNARARVNQAGLLLPGDYFKVNNGLKMVTIKDSYGSTVPIDMGQDKRE